MKTTAQLFFSKQGVWKLAEEKPLASDRALKPSKQISSSVSPEGQVFAQGIAAIGEKIKIKIKK